MLPEIEKEGSPFTKVFGLNIICRETIFRKSDMLRRWVAHRSDYAGLS